MAPIPVAMPGFRLDVFLSSVAVRLVSIVKKGYSSAVLGRSGDF